MKRFAVVSIVFLMVCIAFLFSSSGCMTTGGGVFVASGPGPSVGPPPHAVAHGYRAKHTYRYYPDVCVYFDIVSGEYFYQDGGTWRMSASLPVSLSLNLGSHVMISMDSDRPYTEFKTHKAKYPPGQMKKKKVSKKKKKW